MHSSGGEFHGGSSKALGTAVRPVLCRAATDADATSGAAEARCGNAATFGAPKPSGGAVGADACQGRNGRCR